MDLREELFDFNIDDEQEWSESSVNDDDLDLSDASNDTTVLD